MARPKGSTKSLPAYRLHKPSGQAVVTLAGQDIYLGPHGTKVSRDEYDRVVGEWMARGRTLAAGVGDKGLSVVEVIDAYWLHAQAYYKPAPGTRSGEVDCTREALKVLKRLYGRTNAADFGPLALRAVRAEMVKLGWSRRHVNAQAKRVRRVFKWAAANELVPGSVFHGLLAVEALRKGKSNARETPPVRPVPQPMIDAVRAKLPPTLQAMIDLQLLTGCRPGELVIMRTCDIDTTGDVWVYRPQFHKTEHHGQAREIRIGPKARAILEPLLRPDVQAYIFDPRQAVAELQGALRAACGKSQTAALAAYTAANRHRAAQQQMAQVKGSAPRVFAGS